MISSTFSPTKSTKVSAPSVASKTMVLVVSNVFSSLVRSSSTVYDSVETRLERVVASSRVRLVPGTVRGLLGRERPLDILPCCDDRAHFCQYGPLRGTP